MYVFLFSARSPSCPLPARRPFPKHNNRTGPQAIPQTQQQPPATEPFGSLPGAAQIFQGLSSWLPVTDIDA
jgi:hypothetical protein